MFRMLIFSVITGVCINTALALPGSGTQQDPWRIQSLTDFDEFAANSSYWDDYTRLDTDLDLSGAYQSAVIAPDTDGQTSGFQGPAFTGVFDGNDHHIGNVYIYTGSYSEPLDIYLGLFGKVGSGAEINNLSIDIIIDALASQQCVYVGGLAGQNNGSINNCCSISVIFGGYYRIGGLVGYNYTGEISNSYSCGQIYTFPASTYVGGLIGENYDSPVSYCYSQVIVNMDYSKYVGGLAGANKWSQITKCYASGDVIEVTKGHSDYVGGLVGYNSNSSGIKNCYARGLVDGNDYVGGLVGRHTNSGIRKCYSTGKVSGNTNVGGLVGDSDDADPDVYDSYWDKNTSGINSSDGGTGKSTAQMRRQATFTNWDFTSIWRIADENHTYPRIRFYNIADLNTNGIVNLRDFAILADNWLESIKPQL